MESSPPEITHKSEIGFPDSYKHFNHLPEYTKSLKVIRDGVFFDEAYMATWSGLLMHFDKKNHPELVSPLIDALNSSSAEGESKVEEAWKMLRPVSAYPIFISLKNKLDLDNYGPKSVSKWEKTRHPGWVTASEIYPNIDDPVLIHRAQFDFGYKLKALSKRLNDEGRGDLVPYVTSLYLLETARNLSQGVVFNVMQKWADPNVTVKLGVETKDYLKEILYKTHLYHYFSKVFGAQVREHEKRVFGEDADIAGNLWRALVFVREEAPEDQLRKFRKGMVNLLLDREYDKARFLVEEFLASYPETMPKFVEDQLDIEPKVLSELRVEEDLAHKEKKERKIEERKEFIEKAKIFVGGNLVSSDGNFSVSVTFNDKIQKYYIKPIRGVDSIRKGGIRISPQDLLALVEIYDFKPQIKREEMG